ncbi:MAG: TolB family protein [Gaiellaceae bacterium]
MVARKGICGVAAVLVVLMAAACGDGGQNRAAPKDRHLVYVAGESARDASVWIAAADGGHARKLSEGSAGVLSPDGRTVAVQRRAGGVALLSADGKTSHELTAQRLHPQAWSPDGKTLYATAATGPAVVKLLGLDRETGRARQIASGSLYGFDLAPDGKHIVYSRAPEATDQGICGDQFDLYVADPDGGSAKRITHDGLSAFPVWGDSGIAFSHFPPGRTLEDCSSPGIWTIGADGGEPSPVIARAPDSIVVLGFYGLQPLAWLDGERLLIGLRSEFGTKAAVLDTKSHRLRQFDDYADIASSDGRFYVGSGGDEGLALTIRRVSDGHRVLLRENACCPSWNR